MATRTIVSLLGSCVLFTVVKCDVEYPTDTHPKEEKGIDKHFFGGLFPGKE